MWLQIEQWMEKLGLSYSGQNLASAAFEVLCQLIRAQNTREQLTPEEKNRILEESDYRCAWCCGKSSRFEFDHIVRHSMSFGAAPQCQILCPPCHASKTSNESKNMDNTIFASTFSKRAWSQYVESPRIKPLVYKHRDCHTAACLIADARKYRNNAEVE